jgi:hypothetical protein
VVIIIKFDFKGNLVSLEKQLCRVYDHTIDWATTVALDPETFADSFEYDAMNRLTRHTKPDATVEPTPPGTSTRNYCY